jgi:imidazolonepropionase
VRDGVVHQVGTSRRVENLAEARDALEINAAGRIVMPGFVDSHTHLLSPPPEASEAEVNLASRLVHDLPAKRLTARARGHLDAMARHGTTTVEVKTGCGHDEAAETKMLRVLAALRDDSLDVVASLLVSVPRDTVASDAEIAGRFERVCTDFLPKASRRHLVRFAEVELDGATSRLQLFNRYLDAALQAGLAAKIHGPAKGAGVAAALAEGRSVVSIGHMEEAASDDARALAGFGGIVTLLPPAGLLDASGFRARDLIDAGAAIAIASNFNPLRTPMLNMQTVIALACMQWGMTAAEAITAATFNGAHAAGCADRVGSIEVGKSADLLLLNISDYRDLAGQFGMNLVHLSMKRGAFIYKEGDVAPLNPADLRAVW